MSFWDLSDGGSAKDTGTEYEIPGGGNFDPIPEGSSVLAAIDEIKWDEKNGDRFVSARWSILSPDEYKNRKIFHKLWVTDIDPSAKDEAKGIAKRDKARKMLAAIDANAGGKLAARSEQPTDDSMSLALCGKPMIITLMEWSIKDRETGDMIRGNWVSAVNPKAKGIDVRPAKPKAAPQDDGFGGSPQAASKSAFDDDEIPF